MRDYSSKHPRTLRPNEIFLRLNNLQASHHLIHQKAQINAEAIFSDPMRFFEQIIGFTPFAYQKEFIDLFINNQFTAARWCRQSGKTYIISALLLWYAISQPNCAIGIVGPSYRQTKRILQRISAFAHKLPAGTIFKPQKTTIHFSNGSSIEAFPNNPDTIRGPTFNVVYADEFNFVSSDQELYDAILYTLGSTNGKFVCSSTPWHSDSVFFKIFNNKDYADYKTSHVPVQRALAPNGPLRPNFVEKIKTQMGDDQSRWRREMEAEWAEDDDIWLNQSLIASCIGTQVNCGTEIQLYDPESPQSSDFYAGMDLAQTRDYCVLSVIEKQDDKLFLRHLKIFHQPTTYASVLAYTKALSDRWGGFQKIRVDTTREGPSFISDMENAQIENAEGVIFSVPRKCEMAGLLKQRMQNHQFFYPLLTWQRPYHGEICNELNVERYMLRNDGTYGYYHPYGTHDDVFWSLALAVYATTNMAPEPYLTIIPR